LSGKWQIVEMEVWDKNALGMFEPAYIALDGKGSGKFLFGCVIAGLDCDDAWPPMSAIGCRVKADIARSAFSDVANMGICRTLPGAVI